MAWKTRQEKLINAVGSDTNLCFQVYACVSTTSTYDTEEEFNIAALKYDVDMQGKSMCTVPIDSKLKDLFMAGLLVNIESQRQIRDVQTELLYTGSHSRGANDEDKSAPLESMAKRYFASLSEIYPNLEFVGKYTAIGEGIKIEFKSITKPYDFDVCHPRDLEQLKPISIIEGYEIHPQ